MVSTRSGTRNVITNGHQTGGSSIVNNSANRSSNAGPSKVSSSDVDLSSASTLNSGLKGSNLMSLPMEISRGSSDRILSSSQHPLPAPQNQLPQKSQHQTISFLIESEASLFGYQFRISTLMPLQLVFKDYGVTSEVRKKAEKDLGCLWRRMRNANLKVLQANTRCNECDESPLQSDSAHKWDPKTLPLVLKLSLHFGKHCIVPAHLAHSDSQIDALPTLLKQFHLDEIVAEFEDVEASYKQNHLPCPFF